MNTYNFFIALPNQNESYMLETIADMQTAGDLKITYSNNLLHSRFMILEMSEENFLFLKLKFDSNIWQRN
jgi:ureidoglycolate hydrolase